MGVLAGHLMQPEVLRARRNGRDGLTFFRRLFGVSNLWTTIDGNPLFRSG